MVLKIEAKIIATTRDASDILYDLEVNAVATGGNFDNVPEDLELAFYSARSNSNEETYDDLVAQLRTQLNTDYSLGVTLDEVHVRGLGQKGPKGDKGHVFRDTWVSGGTYAVDDVVLFDGTLYISQTAHSGVTTEPDEDIYNASTDPLKNWRVFTSKPPVWRGEWSETPTGPNKYRKGDVVKRNKRQYIALSKHTPTDGNKPPSGQWDLYLEEGDQGPAGNDGPAGPEGGNQIVAFKGDKGLRAKRIPKNAAAASPVLTSPAGRFILLDTIEMIKADAVAYTHLTVRLFFAINPNVGQIKYYLIGGDSDATITQSSQGEDIEFSYVLADHTSGVSVTNIPLTTQSDWLKGGRRQIGIAMIRVNGTTPKIGAAGKFSRIVYALTNNGS